MTDPFTIRKVIEAQLELAMWWRLPTAQSFGKGFIESTGGPIKDYVGEYLAQAEAESILECEPFLITKLMVEVFEQASKTFPGDQLARHELPVENGFMFLERPVWFDDIHGNPMNIRVIIWRFLENFEVVSKATGESFKTGGLFITVYSDRDSVQWMYENKTSEGGITAQDFERFSREFAFPSLVLLHAAPFAFAHYDFTRPGNATGESLLPFLRAAWAIMQQPLAMRSGAALPRGLRREMERKGITLPTLNVITLRKAMHKQPTGNEVDVEWSHRWLVRGHWRKYVRPEGTRYTWIHEYIKGPEDLPLIIKERAFRVSR